MKSKQKQHLHRLQNNEATPEMPSQQPPAFNPQTGGDTVIPMDNTAVHRSPFAPYPTSPNFTGPQRPPFSVEKPAWYQEQSGNPKARAQAIARAREYVDKNPGNSYGYDAANPKPEPGKGNIDCSGLVRTSIIGAGYPDPFYNPETQKPNPGVPKKGGGTWANGVGLLASHPKWNNVETENLEEGHAALFRTNRTNHQGDQGELDHIGLITKVIRDENKKVTGFEFIHSFGTAPGGPQEDIYELAKPKSWLQFMGAFAWDYDLEQE